MRPRNRTSTAPARTHSTTISRYSSSFAFLALLCGTNVRPAVCRLLASPMIASVFNSPNGAAFVILNGKPRALPCGAEAFPLFLTHVGPQVQNLFAGVTSQDVYGRHQRQHVRTVQGGRLRQPCHGCA